jgi:hypothetical protein
MILSLMLRPTSVGQSVLQLSTHLWLTTRFLLPSHSCMFFHVGHSLWREDGSVVYNCCWPRHCSHFRVRVPWDLWPYFTVSESRLPFSSCPTNRRATVEVFHPASTRECPRISVSQSVSQSESELLYDWRFTDSQSVLAPSPLTLTARIFFLNWTLALVVLI